jgi:hypothetical protein
MKTAEMGGVVGAAAIEAVAPVLMLTLVLRVLSAWNAVMACGSGTPVGAGLPGAMDTPGMTLSAVGTPGMSIGRRG